MLAVCLFACQIVGALGEAQYFQISMRVGLQIKSALLASVFSKSLRLSQASRESVGGGKLTIVIISYQRLRFVIVSRSATVGLSRPRLTNR